MLRTGFALVVGWWPRCQPEEHSLDPGPVRLTAPGLRNCLGQGDKKNSIQRAEPSSRKGDRQEKKSLDAFFGLEVIRFSETEWRRGPTSTIRIWRSALTGDWPGWRCRSTQASCLSQRSWLLLCQRTPDSTRDADSRRCNQQKKKSTLKSRYDMMTMRWRARRSTPSTLAPAPAPATPAFRSRLTGLLVCACTIQLPRQRVQFETDRFALLHGTHSWQRGWAARPELTWPNDGIVCQRICPRRGAVKEKTAGRRQYGPDARVRCRLGLV